MTDRKVVGVLGGMGPDATVDFMSKVIALTPSDKDQDHIHMLVDHNPTVPNRQHAILGDGEDPGPAMAAMAKRLEDAGAFAVECEVIPERVMREIHKRTGLVTISLGSGRYADVMFLFMSDICGESERLPRHARAYGDLASLHAQVAEARVEALTAYRADVTAGRYPGEAETAGIDDAEFEEFVSKL